MTEDEARTTLCHRTLIALPHEHGGVPQPVRGGLCVASDCMAWGLSHPASDEGGCMYFIATGKPNYLFPRGVAPPVEPPTSS